jgi:hypothetical protein
MSSTTTTEAAPQRRVRTAWFVVGAILVTLLVAGVASYYASSSPDGLEKVAADKGLDANATDHSLADGPLADYGVTGVDNERMSVGLAGVIGVVVTLAVAGGLFLLVRKKDGSPAGPEGGA